MDVLNAQVAFTKVKSVILTEVQVAQVATFGSWAEKKFFFSSAPAIPDPAADQSDWSPVWIG